MQIVIDMPESDYQKIIHHYEKFPRDISRWEQRIVDGIVLPENYGDLVDRDEIDSRFCRIWKELKSFSNQPTYKELLDKLVMCLDTAKPIIENHYE